MNEDQPTSQVAIAGPAPVGVSQGSASAGVGCVGGGQTVFYYVIARFPSGLAYPPTGPIIARNTAGIGNLSNTNFNTISWPPASGATGYDVIRRRTREGLNTPCTSCAFVLNTSATTVNDTGQNGGDYPPAGFGAVQDATGIVQLDNTTAAAPFLTSRVGGNPPLRNALIKTFTPGAGAAYDANGNLVNAAGSAGTVTSITGVAPLTLTPNPITGVGTAAIDTTIVAQKFFGSGAPGSVAGNLPGDTYIDSVSHAEYYCAAPAGTVAPACTAVGVGNWTQVGGAGSITATAPLIFTPNPITGVGTAAIDTTVVAQKFFGSGAPGSVAGNLPGDTYIDSVTHLEYYCAAPAGTAAPACTAVGTGNWTIGGTSVAVAPPYITVSGTTYGPIFALTAPPSAGWTIVNGGSTTATPVNTSIVLAFTPPTLGSDALRAYMRALPASTGYTASMGILSLTHGVGFAIGDGTKFIAIWQNGGGNITAFQFNTATSVGSAYFTAVTNLGQSAAGFFGQFKDVGGNRTFSVSADGVNWQAINTQATGTFLTETQFGIIYETNQIFAGIASLVHVVSSTP